MENNSNIDRAIATGEWDSAALTELDNLINDIENGRKHFKRFPLAAERHFGASSRLAAKASVILRGEADAGSTQQRLTKLQRRKRDQAASPRQERIIESWAKAEGIWYENLSDAVRGLRLLANHSSEAVVYDNGLNLTKIVSLNHFFNPQFVTDRIILHNMFFPVTSIKLLGFGRDFNNLFGECDFSDFRFVVDQPYTKGVKPSIEQIKTFMEKSGFEQQRTPTTYKNDYFIISDLHEGNVIHATDLADCPLYDDEGNPTLFFIDTDCRLNTPDQGKDGKYVVDNGIE